MAKKLEIDVTVNTQQVEKVTQKLGQLKDLGRGLKIQYDIDGKPIDIVIDKSKNLQQQFKLVTAELKRTKEGTAEFQLLANKQGDIQDALARTKAKSGDLLTSLQLLPGPVGDFASKINGAISALKLFTSFSVKDIAFQFKQLNDDLNDVVKNLFGVGSSANKAKAEVVDTLTTVANTASETANTTATTANADAQIKSAEAKATDTAATEADTLATLKNTLAQIENQIELGRNNAEWVKNEIAKYNAAAATGDLTAAQKINTLALEQEKTLTELDTLQIEKKTLVTEIDTVAKEANTVATNTLTASLKAFFTSTLGIITVVAAAAYGIYKLVTAKRELSKEEKLAAEVNEKAIKDNGDLISKLELLTEQVKTGGLTQREKNKAVNEYNEKLGDTLGKVKSYSELEAKLITTGPDYVKYLSLKSEAEAAYSLSIEKNKELIAERLKVPTASAFDVWANGGVLGFFYEGFKGTAEAIKARTLKGLEQGKQDFLNIYKDLNGQAQALADKLKIPVTPIKTEGGETKKIENDNKKANDLLLKLKQENTVALLNEERKKQDAQLKIDKENEESEIKNLKLSKDKEELRGKLLEQVRIKYAAKVIDLNKKRQEEDNKSFDESQKKVKEYQDKIFEILNNANQDELSRNKATRTKKFEDDKAALQADANFQKQSLEDKIRILLALEKGYNNDIQKLDDDDAQKKRDSNLKKLDDELKFLQIKGEALREGTRSYFENQRAILKAAEKKEFADLADKAIKEKLTTEQVEKEKLAIKEKYAKAGKELAKQELDQYLQYATTILGSAQNIVSQISQNAQLSQQVATENLTKAYIAQNEYDKKTITNQEEQEKKLLENKKKFAKDEDDLKKKAFEENKKIQIAQAIIGTLQGAVQAYQSLAVIPIVGPALGAVAAAAALVFGYKQVSLIKQTSYQSSLDLTNSETPNGKPAMANYGRNYEKGGMIGGKRHAEGGTLIEAEKGEAIMTRGAVATFGPLLSLMNQAGGGTSFNSNLLTTRQDNPKVANPAQEQAPLIVKSYVVSQELTTEQQKQGRLKNLSVL